MMKLPPSNFDVTIEYEKRYAPIDSIGVDEATKENLRKNVFKNEIKLRLEAEHEVILERNKIKILEEQLKSTRESRDYYHKQYQVEREARGEWYETSEKWRKTAEDKIEQIQKLKINHNITIGVIVVLFTSSLVFALLAAMCR